MLEDSRYGIFSTYQCYSPDIHRRTVISGHRLFRELPADGFCWSYIVPINTELFLLSSPS